MRTGAEIKVGLITVLATILVVIYAFYIRGYRVGAESYRICVVYDDAGGLQSGDPVRMVGVKIGEVGSVEIDVEALKARVWLDIDARYNLYDNYLFRIVTSGLLQERFVEVVPSPFRPDAALLPEGFCADGMTAPGISDLVESGQPVLDSLRSALDSLNVVLTDQDILTGVKDALQSFSAAAQQASALADNYAELAASSEPEITATLEELRGAANDVHTVTALWRSRLATGDTMGDLEETARQASEAASNAARVTESLAGLLDDPEVRAELRATVSAIHEAAQSARRIGEDLEVLSGELSAAAPAVPRLAHEAEEIADASAALRDRLKPPQMDAAFEVLYGGNAERTFSSAWLDLDIGEMRFLRLGVDDIGEESDASLQIGERVGPKGRNVFRYGLVRSSPGVGVDYGLSRGITLTLDVFDPNDLRFDFMADIPFVLRQSEWKWSTVIGARDLGGDETFVGGLRLEK
ncbi:MAG: MlaD family protein [Planctomycetota bacterium]|jgi:phospholipid/cholesterol/gamma-HCH transport system substrate-binding protein